jgi:hypothetical protein
MKPSPPRPDDVRPEELVKVIKTEPKDEGLEKVSEQLRPRGPFPRGIVWGVAGLVVLFIGGSFVSFYLVRGRVNDAIATNLSTLRAGVTDLQNLDPKSAQQEFSSLQNSPSDLGGFVNSLGFLFQGGKDAVTAFSDLSNQLALLSQEVSTVESSAFGFLVNGQGGQFVADLNRLRTTVDTVDAASGKLSGAASFTGGLSSLGIGDTYLSLQSEVGSARSFLDAFVPWLSGSGTHHVLVLLQNPSEIRPAGGFLGSYADITLASSTITDISVHDIADVDIAFTEKIVPPKPLQLITTKWRPADANWFFDFPTTASKTVAFFEESDLYAKTSTTFDGVIAISPNVVKDLLAMTGPIAIGKPTTTFSADTFLVQIQKIVQNGQATSATYPKQVLRDLSGALFAKLASSTDDQKQQLLSMVLDWADKKDVMVYFKDPALQRFFDNYGASGAVYDLPQKFNGDYFAAVDANVGGDKSDLYVSSTISYISQINTDGTLTGHIIVTRKHNGNKSPYSWYKTTSQDYLQLFVPLATSLSNASGGVQKKITAQINYAKSGYVTDSLVTAIEGTEQTIFGYPALAWHEDSGKEVFTTWLVTKAGATTKFSLDYTHRLFLTPTAGVQYQFVFEKQAGTVRHYSFEVDAPLGYVFVENGGLASYTYTSDDPPGRMVVNLTLQKLAQ